MIKYAKIIDETTKQCQVGTGTNVKFYQSIGMTEIDVEQAYNGQWYVKGHAPKEPEPEIQIRVREIRNGLLNDSDKYLMPDFPIDMAGRESYKLYRQYLRDYTQSPDWWESEPLKYEDWLLQS